MEIASRDFTSPRTPRGRFISPFTTYPVWMQAKSAFFEKKFSPDTNFFRATTKFAVFPPSATIFAIAAVIAPYRSYAFFDALAANSPPSKNGIIWRKTEEFVEKKKAATPLFGAAAFLQPLFRFAKNGNKRMSYSPFR